MFSGFCAPSCFRLPIRLLVHPVPPAGPVAATSEVALRFPAFNGTMGSYDCSTPFPDASVALDAGYLRWMPFSLPPAAHPAAGRPGPFG